MTIYGGDPAENGKVQKGNVALLESKIFSTSATRMAVFQTFCLIEIFDGGDLMKNDDFQEGKMVADGRFLGGDPTKNCNFQRGKVGLLCNKNS